MKGDRSRISQEKNSCGCASFLSKLPQEKPFLVKRQIAPVQGCHKEEDDTRVGGCDRHQLRLLAKCTNCETPFPIPALWVQGECLHCFLPFATMAKRQKPV
jgi:hypothetical protein